EIDDYVLHDDCTCEVIYCRRPRKLLVVTGPSLRPERDTEMAVIITLYDGAKAVCGGTTSMIIARELGLAVDVDISGISGDLPPEGKLSGIDLVTEGILTLCRVSELLDSELWRETPASPASKLIELMMNNDIIEFLVGTKINEAHQDPSMPLEIEIRRNIVKKIMHLLEEKYLKKVSLRFI
ncbi:MAG: SpoIIE family protein phosphatase, partial [Spirochaetota bacterium]